MANELKITDIVDPKALKEVSSLTTRLKNCSKAFTALTVAIGEGIKDPVSSFAALQAKTKEYELALLKLKEVEKEKKSLQKQLADQYKAVEQQVLAATKAQGAKAKADAAESKAQENLAKASAAASRAEREAIKTAAERERQQQKQTKSTYDLNRALNEEAKSLAEASAQNAVLRKAIRDLDMTLESSKQKWEEYTAKINQNDEFMDKYSDNMTKRKRNIGNYASAFDGLGMSVQQVARELPALSMGFNTFFLAISNNLPMLADEIKKARVEFQAMKAAGEKATPVWMQLGKAILSWQTALVVGITLLSMYGKEIMEWVSGLIKGNKELDAMKEAEKALNDARSKGIKDSAKERSELELLYKASQDTTRSMKERNDAVDALQKKYPKYFGNMDNEAILAGKAAGAYDKLKDAILAQAQARAMSNKMTELYEKRLDAGIEYARQKKIQGEYAAVSNNGTATIQQGYGGQYGNVNYISTLTKESEAYLEATRSMEKYNKEIENYQAQIDELIKMVDLSALFEDISGGDTSSQKIDLEKALIESRIRTIIDGREKEIAELEKSFNEEMAQYTGNTKKEIEIRENLEIEKQRKLDEINDRYALQEKKANDELEELRLKQIKEEVDASLAAIDDEYAAKAMTSTVIVQDLLERLSDDYAKGILTAEEYEKEKYEITKNYGVEQAELAISLIEKQLEVENLTAEQRMAIEKALAEAKLSYVDEVIAKNEEEAQQREEQLDRLRESFDAIKEIGEDILPGIGDVFDGLYDIFEKLATDAPLKLEDALTAVAKVAQGVSDIVSGIYEKQIEAIEEKQKANEEAGEAELERIEQLAERGAISEEESEARKRIAEEKTAAKNKELEKQKAQLQERQAKFEKANSIAQTIIATALAVTKALPNFVLAALVGAMGAVQLATIVAQPIPKYAKGTKDHKGGLAWVGDGGRSEAVITDNGIWATPSVPTLVDLPEHAVVIPDIKKILDVSGFDPTRKLEPRSAERDVIVNVANDYSRLERKTEMNANELREIKKLLKKSNRMADKAYIYNRL